MSTNVNPRWKKLLLSLAWPPQLMSVSLFIMCVCPKRSICPRWCERPNEMEFDARVIQGQRAEGAVYPFKRATRSLPPFSNIKEII